MNLSLIKPIHSLLTQLIKKKMAYITQAEKKAIAPNVKRILKRYGLKGTLSINNLSTLVLTVSKGSIRFNLPNGYRTINEHRIDENYTGEVKDCLLQLVDAMKGPNWFDKSDTMTDYFHVKHYISIHIGKYNKPYVWDMKGYFLGDNSVTDSFIEDHIQFVEVK